MLPTYASFTAFGYGASDIMAADNTKVQLASSTHTAAAFYTCLAAAHKSANQASNATPAECREMRDMHK
jgi:hypothetical protein